MIRTIKLLIILICFTAADPGSLIAQEQWKSVGTDHGVAIYSHRVAGHEESEFKGVIEINQPMAVIGAVLADIPAYTAWFYNCRQARKIPQANSTAYNFMVYIALDTPWPLWPRDIVYEVKINIDSPAGKIEVRGKAVPEPLVPNKEGHVRITDSELLWILEKINMHRTKMLFIMRTDAGGSVGSYWADLGCRKTIYHSLINLQRIASDPKYEALGRKMSREYAPND